jgi:hypothetical protein
MLTVDVQQLQQSMQMTQVSWKLQMHGPTRACRYMAHARHLAADTPAAANRLKPPSKHHQLPPCTYHFVHHLAHHAAHAAVDEAQHQGADQAGSRATLAAPAPPTSHLGGAHCC